MGVALTPLSPQHYTHPLLPAPPPLGWPGGVVDDPLMGMLSWQPGDLQQLLKQLITKLRPETLSGQSPCLPAHLLFMCLRYADHCRNEGQAMGLLEGVVSSLRATGRKSPTSMDDMVFWMANAVQLWSHLHQYSAQQVRGHTHKSHPLHNIHSLAESDWVTDEL